MSTPEIPQTPAQETPHPPETAQGPAQEAPAAPGRPASEPRSGQDPLQDILRGLNELLDKDQLKSTYGAELHLHYNTYQGNYVHNTGTIGSIDQSQGGGGDAPLPVPAKGLEERVRAFFQLDCGLDALTALITLATFQLAPEAAFHEAAQSLRAVLAAQLGLEEAQAPAGFQTAQALLAPFPLQYVDDPAAQNPGAPAPLCLTFRSPEDPPQIRAQVWREYPQLRGSLTQWLLELRRQTASAASRRMGYAAMQGLACYASLDPAYARDTMVPSLEHSCTAQADVKYLTVFFHQLLLWEDSRGLADLLLCRWCGRHGGILWQVPYRLAGQGEGLDFPTQVPDALEAHLKRDLSQSTHSFLDWYRQDRGYLLRPAHEDQQTAQLLAEGLARCLLQRRDTDGRRCIAIYFLTLFRWDYLTDFSHQPSLVFLRGLRRTQTRKALLPLFQLVWRQPVLRDTARQILECHMREISLCRAPYAYLEKPFVYLAFTDRSSDYYNTCSLLKQCAQQPEVQPVAQHLMDFLEQQLEKNRASST